MSAVHDGRCSPWVMCSCSVVRGNQICDKRAPPLCARSSFSASTLFSERLSGAARSVKTDIMLLL